MNTILRVFPCFLAGIICLMVTGCLSHQTQIKDAQQAAAVDRTNAKLAQSAILMRVSDYGQETKYAVSLMPDSVYKKAATNILDLQIDLAGSGQMTEQKREAFVQLLLKDNSETHLALTHEGDENIALKAKVAKADKRADQSETKANDMALQAATAWDSVIAMKDYFILAVVVLVAIYVIHLFIIYGKKIPSL